MRERKNIKISGRGQRRKGVRGSKTKLGGEKWGEVSLKRR